MIDFFFMRPEQLEAASEFASELSPQKTDSRLDRVEKFNRAKEWIKENLMDDSVDLELHNHRLSCVATVGMNQLEFAATPGLDPESREAAIIAGMSLIWCIATAEQYEQFLETSMAQTEAARAGAMN